MTINPIGVKTPKAVQPQFKGLTEVLTKVVTAPNFDKIADFAAENSSAFNAASSLIMAGVLRPAAIMALPAKDEQAKKNKGNAAAHAIASGLISFVVTSIAMKPLADGIKKLTAFENVRNYLPQKLIDNMYKPSSHVQGEMVLNQFGKNAKKVMQFAPDIILAIPRALLTSKLSHTIEDILFKKKSNKKETEQPQQKQQIEQTVQVAQAQSTDRPVLDGFKGGNK